MVELWEKKVAGLGALGGSPPPRTCRIRLFAMGVLATIAVLALASCSSGAPVGTQLTREKVADPIVGDWEGYTAINARGETAPVNHSSLAVSFSYDSSRNVKIYDYEYPGEWSVSNTAETLLDKRMSNRDDILGYYEINLDDKTAGSMTGILSRQDDGSLYLMLYRHEDTTFVLVRKE